MQRMPQQDSKEITLPYLMFGDEFPVYINPHCIEPHNEEKRIRVFRTQLVDTIIDNTKLSNFNFNIGVFFKFGTRLVSKYPHRESELNQIMMDFWRRMQYKYKQLQEKL